MIVRRLPQTLQLITQPDHAHLARRIMEHCVALQARPRRATILLAIGEHDNGWAEEDAAPIVNPDNGDVFDFVKAPLRVRHQVWPRAVARLSANPWAAALVAHHAITVYDRFRADAEWTSFFSDMESMREEQLRASGLPLEELGHDYAFVRLGDLISLTFCTAWSDDQRFAEWTVRRSGTSVTVTPDAFGRTTIPIEIRAREIPNRSFRSDADLRDALREAQTITLRGAVS